MSDDLSKLTRDELNTMADELGVADAAALSTKADVIAAIAEIEVATDPDPAVDPDADPESDTDPVEGTSYRVLKAITVDSGQTYMPGDSIVIDATWPARRAKQLVEQKFLAPEGDAQ